MGQDVPVTITVAPRIELNEVAVEIPRDLPTAAVQASTKVQASERSSMEDPSAQNSESSAGNEQADSTQLISNEEHPAILERQAALKSVTGRGVSQDAVNQAHGMYGAKSSLTMPKVEQASEHLHRELQSLPSETNSVSYTADPAGVLMPSAVVPRLDLAKGQTIGQSNFPVNFDQGTVLDQSDETVENIGSSATPAIPVQDLHVDIARAVVELKRLRTDSMSVVLRPDAHTELQLQLQVHPHGVEIEAQYRRGDLDHLQAHWLQLQQSLSPQGIRLGPLLDTSAEQGNSSGRGSFQQPSEGKQTFEEPSGSWLPRVASPAAASRVVAEPVSTSNRILESWA
jgi:hypothetical protein